MSEWMDVWEAEALTVLVERDAGLSVFVEREETPPSPQPSP
jgi:hypothetical protein